MRKKAGNVWRYGHHVDTDVIIPARYLNIADHHELAEHAMEDIDADFAKQARTGDYIVAGKNFGCGSSREHAPLVLKVRGVPAVIADSFARIFYRNAINIGLPAMEIGEEVEKIEDGDTLEVDAAKGEIKITNKNITIATKPLPGFIQEITKAGGLINYVKGKN
ncbi:MAG: 3-isopropylmalate dehydratase small subunit [Acidaminococcales bacterium]|jgi:3-isopropylmalate/(R)-2-methylmalate dehydratase small subunit|nr:3-isopropylmalate dehydratase small subunit [Acidaminococcales bacterium]